MKRLAALILIALCAVTACTPKEVETSVHTGEVCILGGAFIDSDGNAWSSQNCASHSRVDLTQGHVENDGWSPRATIPTPTTTTTEPADIRVDGVHTF